jgi:hypothetical protein
MSRNAQHRDKMSLQASFSTYSSLNYCKTSVSFLVFVNVAECSHWILALVSEQQRLYLLLCFLLELRTLDELTITKARLRSAFLPCHIQQVNGKDYADRPES